MILQIGKLKLLNRKSSCPVRNSYDSRIKFSNREGFTLIELLLVVAIILILAGLNFPALSKQFNRLKLENCALDILSICRYARQSAIAQSRVYRLNFNLNEKSYYLSREKDAQGQFENIPGRFARKFSIPSDISLDISRQEINFYPNAEYDSVEIILTNPDNLRSKLFKSGAFDELEIREEKQ